MGEHDREYDIDAVGVAVIALFIFMGMAILVLAIGNAYQKATCPPCECTSEEGRDG